MTRTVHNLRLAALILAIGAGLMLEAHAGAERSLAGKDCLEMPATDAV